jgi:ubiquinone/menaquinone biosynthesis C-methylase UbiE
VREIADAVPPAWDLTVLDVGTGGLDLPLDLLRTWGARWPRLWVTAVDARVEVLDAALALRPEAGHESRLIVAVADGRSLPFPDGAFDVAHASLVLHHLDPDEAVAFLKELARVSRRAVVVNDLVRARIHWLGAQALGRCCTRNAYTRNDGPLSVRRAYTTTEVETLLGRAGLRRVALRYGFARHRYVLTARRSA